MQRTSSPRAQARFSWRLPAALILAAVGTLILGSIALWRHEQRATWSFDASAGVVLILAALVQLRIALVVWKTFIGKSSSYDNRSPFSFKTWLRQFVVGGMVCYLVALVIGPGVGIEWAFVAGVAVWLTLTLLPLAAQPNALEGLRKLLQGRQTRRIGYAAYLFALALIGGELALRAAAWLPGVPATAGAARAATADTLTENSGEFHIAIVGSAIVRRAIVGNEVTQAPVPAAYLAHLKTLSPGIEIQALNGAPCGLETMSSSVAGDLHASRPDLVLVLIRPSDLTNIRSPSANIFDWRNLRLGQCVASLLNDGTRKRDEQRSATELNDPALPPSMPERLAVCRVPIDQPTQQRWQHAFTGLDELIAECRHAGINVALVLAPDEFQVNPVLCDTLRRRLGYTMKELDLDLPQRRLAAFANQRGVPVLDLLPHLRVSDQSSYSPSHADWNDHGNEIVAQALSGWLHERYAAQIAAGTAQYAAHEGRAE